MKLKHIAITAALATTLSTGAVANDVVNNIAVTGNTIWFGALHSDNLPFTDIFNFTNVLGPVSVNAALQTIGFAPGQNVDFSHLAGGITLNGVPLTVSPTGVFETASLAPVNLVGPLQLIVHGTTDAGKGTFSSYSGVLNVVAIPEPETYAMMLAGLGLLGFVSRRRKHTAA